MFWHGEKKTPLPLCTADSGLSLTNSNSCLGRNKPYLWILIRRLHLALSFCSTAVPPSRGLVAVPMRRSPGGGQGWVAGGDHSCLAERERQRCRQPLLALLALVPPLLPRPPALLLSLPGENLPFPLQQQGYALGPSALGGAPSPEKWGRLSPPACHRRPHRSRDGCQAPLWAEASIPNKAE